MSSFLRSILLAATVLLVTLPSAVGANCFWCTMMSPALQSMVPSQCYNWLQKAGECFVERNCQKCLGPTVNSAFRSDAVLDFFQLPTTAQTCAEFEAPICPLTATCCSNCRGRINTLYRCIIRNSQQLTPEVKGMQKKCMLDCQGGGDPTPAPTVAPVAPTKAPAVAPTKAPVPPTKAPTAAPKVNSTEAVVDEQSGNATDTNSTDDADADVGNATETTTTTTVDQAVPGRIRGSDTGY